MSVLTCASLRARSLNSMVASAPASSAPTPFSYTGTRSIAQIGHLPGLSILTDGCIPQVQCSIFFSFSSSALAEGTQTDTSNEEIVNACMLKRIQRMKRITCLKDIHYPFRNCDLRSIGYFIGLVVYPRLFPDLPGFVQNQLMPCSKAISNSKESSDYQSGKGKPPCLSHIRFV